METFTVLQVSDKKYFFASLQPMESAKESRFKRFKVFLRKKYRLVILNDTTFAERFSLRLSPWGLIIGVSAITIVMTTLVISLVAFTPLREYIPGYGDVHERKLILGLTIKADSLEQTIASRDLYLRSILDVIHERAETKSNKPAKDTTGKYRKVNIEARSSDLAFRKDFERSKGIAGSNVPRIRPSGLSEVVFFTPVNGYVTESFDYTDEHYGVDIVTKQDETVKSTLEGTIVFAGFSASDGNVIHIQHTNNLISIYKHCAAFLKDAGDRVKSGEAIAVVGNTGENSNGPHLHFELWFNGSPINPQEFVAF
jgi:murein DD-endopeptidase MepM/ murein hydrolase activator NlpD